ncbi:MAG TPA: VOC family protein [bacterium]|nr:VOC family protein [bacterium]
MTLFVGDADRSVRFYRDGLGFAVLMDREYEADWPALFGVASSRVRAVAMGDTDRPELGQIELVTFAEPVPAGPPATAPATGTAMLAFHIDLEAVLPRLRDQGATSVRRITLARGNAIVTVRDPDGVMVELIDVGRPAAS